MLEIRNLSKTYRRGQPGEVRALAGISFTVDAGEFIAIKGPSGCGKTTLLLAAGALLTPEGGQVRIGGQDPYALGPEARARFRAETIGFVFQQFHLVPYLSVLDNVLAPALAAPLPGSRDRAEALIAQFQLQHRRDHVPAELSTGERQRAALARALLNQPKLLLADEPTGNLDRENADIILGALAAFAQNGGAVLLVSHDDHATRHAARTLRLREGKIAP